MSVDEVFQLLKFRASKSGYVGSISSVDFNLVFPMSEIRYYLKEYGNQNQYQVNNPVPPIAYPGTIKVSTSLSKFGTVPQIINIDASGQWKKPIPNTDFFIDSLAHYVVGTGGTSMLGFTFVGGLGYTNGFYENILLTGGTGSGATANITVVATVVTSVVLTGIGSGYTVNDELTADIPGSDDFVLTITSLTNNEPTPIRRVEKQDLSGNLYSYYEFPTEIFPIYTEYANYIQFNPPDLGTALLTTLRKPNKTFWASTLTGTIALTNTLTPGSGYTNGTYPNVIITGGTGNSAIATITVAGGLVTSVSIVQGGFGYTVGDTLTGSLPAGTGWSFKVATIVNPRQVYDAVNSVDPEFEDFDIDEIVYMALSDMGIFLRDTELQQFSAGNMKTGGIL